MESGKFFKVRKGLSVIGSGSTVVDVKGSKGQIFSIDDTLSDSLFSVNDFSGIPILEVFNDDTVKIGTYNNQGLIVNEDKVEIGNKLTVKGEISSSGSLYLENGENKYITTNAFAPDFGGFGARLETGISGSNDVTAKLTIDDLVVRKRLSVHELLINQIRATNGALFISSVGRIYSASFDGNSIYSLFFDTGSAGSRFAHGFEIGDLILAQRIDPTVTTTPTYVNGRPQEVIYRSEMFVTQYLSSGSIKAVLSSGTTAPQPGFDYVRIGNAASLNGVYTKPNRQGTVYLTSDDQYSPYIDVVDGVVSHNEWFDSSKVKVRIGKLDGITDTISSFGNLSGYGFWASGSAYLEGGINATVGKIGGFTISTDTIVDSSTNEKLILRSNGDITGSQVYFDGGVVGGFSLSTNEITSIDTTSLVLKSSGDITGSKVLFTGGRIGGFKIENGSITYSSSSIPFGGGIESYIVNLNAPSKKSDPVFSIGQKGSQNFSINFNGDITASSAQLTGGTIAGFTISGNQIQGSEFILDASADGSGDYFITSSNFAVKGNGDAIFGEYIIQQANAQNNNINAFKRISSTTNIGVLQALDSNQNGFIIGINTEGDTYIAPFSASNEADFTKELRYDLNDERWHVETDFKIDGNLDIGGNTLNPPLHIKQSSTDAGGGIRLEDATSTNDWNISIDGSDNLTFYYNTSERGYLSNTTNVSNIDFTGQHRSKESENFTTGSYDDLIGLIVISDGTYNNFDNSTSASINEALPNVQLSDKINDKRVFGVISDKEDLENGRTYSTGMWNSVFPTGSDDSERLVINSVGEGGIWVCNYSGSFENGDYITTSPILGLGMNQNDEYLKNYTVAKITQDCSFDNPDNYVEIEFSGSLYKKQFVGCTYHCG